MMRVTVAAPLLRVVMRLCAIYCFIALFGSNSDRAAAQGDAQAAKNLHDVRQTESQTVMQRFLFNRRPWAFDDKEPLYIVNMAQ
jgi:hypothetical protein